MEVRLPTFYAELNHIRATVICSVFGTLALASAAHISTPGPSLFTMQERQDERRDLVGTWKAKSDHRIVFTFAKDGTGSLISDDDTEHFTYSIQENKLVVKQGQETVTFTFSLSSGALILSDAPGWDAPLTFARVLFDPSGFYYLLGAPRKASRISN